MSGILVAGIGNIFMGDDGFGCEVAQRLAQCAWPDGVAVADFGIRGIDLAYTLMNDCDTAILIDTVQRGGAAGTLYVIEPEWAVPDAVDEAQAGPLVAPHEMDPAKVLRFVAALGERCPRVWLVGCEPESLGGDDGHMGLSAPVAAAVERAMDEVRVLVGACRAGGTEDLVTTATAGGTT